MQPYRFIKIILVNGVSGDLDILDHFLERGCDMTIQMHVRLDHGHMKYRLLLNGMSVILFDKGFDGQRHSRLAQQLQLLSTQEFTHQGLHSEFGNLFGKRQFWIIDGQFWLFHNDFRPASGLFGPMEHKDIARVRDLALEFLTKPNGIR